MVDDEQKTVSDAKGYSFLLTFLHKYDIIIGEMIISKHMNRKSH